MNKEAGIGAFLKSMLGGAKAGGRSVGPFSMNSTGSNIRGATGAAGSMMPKINISPQEVAGAVPGKLSVSYREMGRQQPGAQPWSKPSPQVGPIHLSPQEVGGSAGPMQITPQQLQGVTPHVGEMDMLHRQGLATSGGRPPLGPKLSADLGVQAAGLDVVIKAAAAFNIQPVDVRDLGTLLGTDATGMALSALADPASFTQLLKFAADGTLDANLDGVKRLVAAERTPMTQTPKTASVLDALKAVKAASERKEIEKAAADVMRKAIVKKAAEIYRGRMVSFLDKAASELPLTKQAALRIIQTGLVQGKSLHESLKLAFDNVDDYQLGKMASGLVRLACQHKQANALMGYGPGAGGLGAAPTGGGMGSVPTQGPMSATGPAAGAGDMMGKMAAVQPQAGQTPSEGSTLGGAVGGLAGLLGGLFMAKGGGKAGARTGMQRGVGKPSIGLGSTARMAMPVAGGLGGYAAGNALGPSNQQVGQANPFQRTAQGMQPGVGK